MDTTDFPMPSPKRQRTDSPEENKNQSVPTPTAQTQAAEIEPTLIQEAVRSSEESSSKNEILDMLMENLEAEEVPVPTARSLKTSELSALPTTAGRSQENVDGNTTTASLEGEVGKRRDELIAHINAQEQVTPVEPERQDSHSAQARPVDSGPTAGNKATDDVDMLVQDEQPTGQAESVVLSGAQEDIESAETPKQTELVHNPDSLPQEATSTVLEIESPAQPTLTDTRLAAAQVEGIPATNHGLEPAEGAGDAEWEVDSSPYESSTDSDTSSDSSDDSDDEDEEDADGNYAMLDLEEQARILMQDAGSDDEGDRARGKGESSNLRTANEQAEDIPPKPDINVTEDMPIEELGAVEFVVENTVLIRAKTSGEYQVLESGSLLCSKDRTVIGIVAETLGRVEEPLYTVRFRDQQDITDSGVADKGTAVYYVPQHSTFVFTQPLKAVKGSDASNIHDEEVGDEEMEFSDDEAEAEHKRRLKMQRQGRHVDGGRGRGAGRGGRGAQRGRQSSFTPSGNNEMNGAAYGNGSLEMNYDDVKDELEDGYTPLARPSNLHEMMPDSKLPNQPTSPNTSANYQSRGRGMSRGGGRDRGRGGRGNFRGGRGGGNNNNHSNQNRSQQSTYNQSQQQQQQQFQPPFPNPFQNNNSYPQPQPQYSSYNNAQTPYQQQPPHFSPPFPQQQFNFNSHNTNTPYQPPPPPPPQYNPQFGQTPQQPYFQPPQQQQSPQFPNFAPHFQHNNNNGYNTQAAGNTGSTWQVNQAAAAEVQRQLEEMRKAAAAYGSGQSQ